MKKVFIIFLLAVLWSFAVNAQQWVNFSSSEPNAPEVNVLNSTSQSVTFEVTIPGIYKIDTVVNGTSFSRLILPSGAAVNPTGSPELPVLKYKVAMPECSGTVVSYNVISTIPMLPCWVYPVPQFEVSMNGVLEELFTFNSNAYAQPYSPQQVAITTNTGSLREQRYIEVLVQPIEFCPLLRKLSIIDKVSITLSFTNSKGELRQNTGIFNKVAATAFINYDDDGVSAVSNDKAFERKPSPPPGAIKWITLTDTAQAKNIVADYLIICANQFFTPHNTDIQRLAEHRLSYNGFDIAILNVDNILSLPFFYEGIPPYYPNDPTYIKEQKIRTCIRRIYEGKNAHNPNGDGYLAYVLLVGDNHEGNTMMPTSFDHGVYDGNMYPEKFPSDYYFSCVTRNANGIYDDIGDLYIGRYSVEDNEQLYNIVQKTLNHETEYSPKAWRKSAGSTFYSIMITGYENMYDDHISNLTSNIGWSCSTVNLQKFPPPTDPQVIKIPTIDYFNAGAAYVQYFGQCGALPNFCGNQWAGGLNQTYFSNELQNDLMAPFINTFTTWDAHFDNMECLGEFFTRYHPTKGAVGYIGSPRGISLIHNNLLVEGDIYSMHFTDRIAHNLFSNGISIAGELLLISKTIFGTRPDIVTHALEAKHGMVLLGDPALNIFAKGYEVTRDVTADCSSEIDCRVKIHNGATLTIPTNCTFNFLSDGEFIVEDNGNIVIQNNAHLYGIKHKAEAAIHVKGGEFLVGNNVTFNKLNGVFLENYDNFYDAFKTYDLSEVTFYSTPLIHHGSHLNISNCNFNRSNVRTSVSVSNIDNCTFYESLYESSDAKKTEELFEPTTISNCTFIGNFNCPGVPKTFSALQLNDSYTLELYNNSINGYPIGIKLNSSGATTAYYYGCKTLSAIHDNEITNCMRGVELYNSIVNIVNNNIHDNTRGVLLYNNSSTSFYGLGEPTLQHQNIKDNTYYELYASSNSFPAIFRFNNVIDEDNLGNSFDDPMVYWDLDYIDRYPSWMVRDVKYNCWENNFDPREDFYPFKYYDYDPIVCIGKSVITPAEDEALFQTGLDYFSNENYENAQAVFIDVIENYPQSSFAIAAMHELFSLEKILDKDFYRLQSYFTSFTPEDSALFDVADFLATRCNVMEREWQPAIDWYEERIENPPSYQDSVFAVIDLGDIHLIMEEDTIPNGAKGNPFCHYRLENIKPKSKQDFEENRAILLATLPKKPKSENTQAPNSFVDKKGALGQNIPNPATGTTTISYEIYTEGVVEINIYNLAGQLMKSLTQGTCQQGIHQTTISVSSMSVGMYHYSLFVNGERTDTKKLIVN